MFYKNVFKIVLPYLMSIWIAVFAKHFIDLPHWIIPAVKITSYTFGLISLLTMVKILHEQYYLKIVEGVYIISGLIAFALGIPWFAIVLG